MTLADHDERLGRMGQATSGLRALRLWAFPFLVFLICTTLAGLPVAIAYACYSILGPAGLFVAPLAWAVSWALTAALLSLPWQWAIVPGHFERDVGDSLYFARRMYGLCWSAIYYLPIVHQLILSSRLLKAIVYRGFGYRGPLGFTIYPDTWIRDLPLLWLGDGAYIANRSTLGTNIVMPDGTILVDKVTVGSRSLIGHLAVIGPRFMCGERCSVGTRAMVGMSVSLGNDVRVGADAAIDHFVHLADNEQVAQRAFRQLVDSSEVQ